MSVLRESFNVLSLGDALRRLDDGTLPARTVCITFDDGYVDNLEVAAPILRSLGIPATVFVATDFLERGIMWNDRIIEAVRRHDAALLDLDDLGLGRHDTTTMASRRRAVETLLAATKHRPLSERDAIVASLEARCGTGPSRLMMVPAQVRELRRCGVSIGAHTIRHPILRAMAADEARTEIAGSKRQLEALLDEEVALFAYPNGRPGDDYDPVHVEMVREAGYTAAVSTTPGVVSVSSARFELPRYTPWDHAPGRFATKLAVHGFRPGSLS
ncbi:MAG: polysaccharide deacetylase family protein [Ectothiorhodospiraceae bacterium]|nr:polysaccharide deacetylase family protein [Ectothiorhodospiraceae bacterium]